MGEVHGLHSASQPKNTDRLGLSYSFEQEQTTLYKRSDSSRGSLETKILVAKKIFHRVYFSHSCPSQSVKRDKSSTAVRRGMAQGMGRVGNELWNYLPSAEGPRLAQPIQENIESGYDELNARLTFGNLVLIQLGQMTCEIAACRPYKCATPHLFAPTVEGHFT